MSMLTVSLLPAMTSEMNEPFQRHSIFRHFSLMEEDFGILKLK